MDVEYKGQHAIIFFKDVKTGYIKRNSWIDFHMIPATRPYVALGTPNYAAIPIPGTSKRMDVTDYRPGGLTFGQRTGTWEFYIDHNKWSEWDNAYNTIKYYIHGNNFLINLTDDPYVLYQGVLTISGYVAGQNYSKITIQYDLMSETMLLDEPIDFGDFGRLPDPKLLDSDGDGLVDSIDTDGDGDPDVKLEEGIGFDTDCDGEPDIVLQKDKTLWNLSYVRDEGGFIIGLDINGDGNIDYAAFTDRNGVYGIDTNCDEIVDQGKELTPPPEWIDTDGDGKPDGIDLDGDGVIDIPITEGDDGTPGYDTDGDGDPDIPIDPDNLPTPTLIDTDGDGKPDGIDLDGDGVIDIPITEGDDGTPGYDTDGDGDPDIPIRPEPKPEDMLDEDDGTTVYGYDTDCDGVIDIKIDQSNPRNPVYIYDEDSGHLIGVDCNGDLVVDIYATTDENGREGIDFDCDGVWDTPPYTPPGRDGDDGSAPEPGQEDPEGGDEIPVVIGAYYPLLFITNEGESSMYGFASINKSRNMLGVYDLYTIYESDKVTPGSSEGSSDDELIIG